MSLKDLIYVPSGHEDNRRKITDVTEKVKFFKISDLEGLKLGNHYHKNTQEFFYVIDGGVRYKLEDINNPQNREELIVKKGEMIRIPLYVAHLVIPERNSMFLGILQKDFDPADLNKYEITW
jgi:mannose-6-phosphate isomerase-like protein (cupin superfamily)